MLRTFRWGLGRDEGTVALEEGSPTVVDQAGRVVVPVPPTDFTWDADAGELSGSGHTFSAGDFVSLGGGNSETSPSIVEYFPSCCAGGQYFVVHSA